MACEGGMPRLGCNIKILVHPTTTTKPVQTRREISTPGGILLYINNNYFLTSLQQSVHTHMTHLFITCINLNTHTLTHTEKMVYQCYQYYIYYSHCNNLWNLPRNPYLSFVICFAFSLFVSAHPHYSLYACCKIAVWRDFSHCYYLLAS